MGETKYPGRSAAMIEGYLTTAHRRELLSREVNENKMSNPGAIAIASFSVRHGEFMDKVVEAARDAVFSATEDSRAEGKAELEKLLNIIQAAEAEKDD